MGIFIKMKKIKINEKLLIGLGLLMVGFMLFSVLCLADVRTAKLKTIISPLKKSAWQNLSLKSLPL